MDWLASVHNPSYGPTPFFSHGATYADLCPTHGRSSAPHRQPPLTPRGRPTAEFIEKSCQALLFTTRASPFFPLSHAILPTHACRPPTGANARSHRSCAINQRCHRRRCHPPSSPSSCSPKSAPCYLLKPSSSQSPLPKSFTIGAPQVGATHRRSTIAKPSALFGLLPLPQPIAMVVAFNPELPMLAISAHIFSSCSLPSATLHPPHLASATSFSISAALPKILSKLPPSPMSPSHLFPLHGHLPSSPITGSLPSPSHPVLLLPPLSSPSTTATSPSFRALLLHSQAPST